jgi:signal transduction histidine kinase
LFIPIFVPYAEIDFTEYLRETSVRAMFYAIVAFLVYQQAKAKRDEMARTEAAAASLAQANSDLQEAQASLRRSERLAALGQLTAGLAHELRNPLGTIKASSEMLSKPMAKNNPAVMDEMAGYIRTEVDRMNGLIANFLDFARPLQIHPAVADLEEVLQEVIREQGEPAKGRGVEIVLREGGRARQFRFDHDLLRVALTNLVQNAVQASAEGQKVEVITRETTHEVVISVRDEGEGILPEHRESIFNPFFTTKPTGVGLGLALVAKIVDEHGGRVNVWSDRDKGTTFEIALPKS